MGWFFETGPKPYLSLNFKQKYYRILGVIDHVTEQELDKHERFQR